ncbi:cobalamin-dependent protein [Mycobacterium sp. ITM-2016-00317]|uniref:cobalamin B12-binding domain-containing protein n=1 Tax=Mycobacterium sp. ITM-2016-00317 TaxID=2099694 RepID=UPI000D486F39|nr:cobalamin-dependent protein [Mycobacterium sp. ITM-2016-00317]WNG87469.1 cobalamin-dependent protein [Mycobacterium sp. ITM-2016-00317]
MSDDTSLVRQRLWDAVRDGDERTATTVVFAALDGGMAAEDVLLDVIAPVQHRVGTEWAANRVTVAQEHAATAINDRVIAALAHHPACAGPGSAGRVTVACVDGEWHALPARLLAEVLTLRGWHVDFLGAQVPTPHLVAHLHQHGPDAVALSGMIPTRLPTAHAAITACQAAGVAVLAGGAAFGADGRFARKLGADAWAPDARTAAALLGRGLRPTQALAHPPQLVDDLAHLMDQEYTMVRDSGPRLIETTMRELDERFPAMRGYTQQQRRHTLEDIAHIVEFLTAALYVDDDDLFVGFITWTAEILSARGVPATSLLPALESIAGQLGEFPRTRRVLEAAHASLHRIPTHNPPKTA